MKIAHVVSTYPPYKGGMGNVAASFVRGLEKKGHKVVVLTPDYQKARERYQFESVTRLKPVFKYGNSAFVPNLYAHLKDVDVIHLHYPFFGGAETVARFKKNHPQIPLVISYHMDVEGAGLLKAFFQIYSKLWMPRILKSADIIIVSSMDYVEASKLFDVREYSNIIELPFGADEEFKSLVDKPLSPNLELLFVGGLDKAHYFKGLSILLEAFAKLLQIEKNTNPRLHIVGDGDLKEQYMALARSLGISDSVIFEGRLSDEKLIQSYQHADLTLLPSVDRSEAFGLVLLESMACGTPVIASNLPGVRSVVKEDETGLLVAPKSIDSLLEALQAMIKNPETRIMMGKLASERVNEKYRWPKIIDTLEEIYKEII